MGLFSKRVKVYNINEVCRNCCICDPRIKDVPNEYKWCYSRECEGNKDLLECISKISKWFEFNNGGSLLHDGIPEEKTINLYNIFVSKTSHFDNNMLHAMNVDILHSMGVNYAHLWYKARESDEAPYYFERAEHYLTESYKHNPKSTDSLGRLAELYFYAYQYDKTVYWCKEIDKIGITPKYGVSLSYINGFIENIPNEISNNLHSKLSEDFQAKFKKTLTYDVVKGKIPEIIGFSKDIAFKMVDFSKNISLDDYVITASVKAAYVAICIVKMHFDGKDFRSSKDFIDSVINTIGFEKIDKYTEEYVGWGNGSEMSDDISNHITMVAEKAINEGINDSFPTQYIDKQLTGIVMALYDYGACVGFSLFRTDDLIRKYYGI